MAIYSFWIFDRHCNCVYSREWEPKVASGSNKLFNYSALTGASNSSNQHSNGLVNIGNVNDNAKLLFGAIFSLRNIASKLYPGELDEDSSPNAINNYLKTFSTANYRVHYFETATNWKFALISDPKLENLQHILQYIYQNIFIQHVVTNALSPVDFHEFEYINNLNFINGVDKYITSLPSFTS